jgi:hypothetical protein
MGWGLGKSGTRSSAKPSEARPPPGAFNPELKEVDFTTLGLAA